MNTHEHQPGTPGARLLATAPRDLLRRVNAAELEQWCLSRGFRPSLWDVEAARARHGAADYTTTPNPLPRPGRVRTTKRSESTST